MLRDAIRTYSTLVELRGWLTIIASKRGMWLRAPPSDQRNVELGFQSLMKSGLISWQQKLETSFFIYANSWLLGASALVSTASQRLPTGNIEWILNHINIPMDRNFRRRRWAYCMSGLRQTWEDAQEVRIFVVE